MSTEKDCSLGDTRTPEEMSRWYAACADDPSVVTPWEMGFLPDGTRRPSRTNNVECRTCGGTGRRHFERLGWSFVEDCPNCPPPENVECQTCDDEVLIAGEFGVDPLGIKRCPDCTAPENVECPNCGGKGWWWCDIDADETIRQRCACASTPENVDSP